MAVNISSVKINHVVLPLPICFCKQGLASHTWIEVRPVQQGLTKFWSMYGQIGCTIWSIDWPVYDQPVRFSPNDKCSRQNTIAQREGIPLPHWLCGWGNWLFLFSFFFFVQPAEHKKKKYMACLRAPYTRSENRMKNAALESIVQ